tara:strand:- start:564 stop:719 length:156 start_codon:yes stop_codon:yes gene_type:complete
MVSYYKLKPKKSKLINRLNQQSNLIEKLINDGVEIQNTETPLSHNERLQIK